MTKTLFTKAANGKLRFWRIDATIHGFNITYGAMGGAGTKKHVDVEVNQSGRSFIEQVHLEIKSRISKQYDKGYVDTLEEAETVPKTNALGMFKPMLAQRIDKVKGVDYHNSLVQRKYNGHRCLIHNSGSELIAYSKNGKPIKTISHITSELQIPVNGTIDGELYIHGLKLQKISSIVKKVQEANKDLSFVAYDIVSDNVYRDRLAELKRIPVVPNYIVAGTYEYDPSKERLIRDTFVKEGYEGAIIRLDGYGYEDGKRTKGLIKVKPTYDMELKVIDIKPSKDGWAILVCEIPAELESTVKTVDVSSPGTMEEKYNVMNFAEDYIGKYINIEYYELTKSKVPFHPVATYWRDMNY